MKRFYIPLGVVAILGYSLPTRADMFANMHQHMKEMHQQMNDMMQQMDDMFKQNQPSSKTSKAASVSMQEDADKVRITVPLSNAESFDATADAKMLTVNVPSSGMLIAIKQIGNYLSVTAEQSAQETTDKKNSKNNQGSMSYYGSSSFGRTIAEKVDLEKAELSYDENTLTINLPKISSKKKLNVAVTRSKK